MDPSETELASAIAQRTDNGAVVKWKDAHRNPLIQDSQWELKTKLTLVRIACSHPFTLGWRCVPVF